MMLLFLVSQFLAVYLEMSRYDDCLAECQKAIDRRYEVKADYEKVAKVFTRMAVCYQRMGDLENCIAMYEKSLMENNNRHDRAALANVKRLKEKRDKEAYIKPELAESVSSHNIFAAFFCST